MRSWSAHLIGGKKMTFLSFVEAASESAAIQAAIVLFSLDDERRKRLVVNLRRWLLSGAKFRFPSVNQ